MTNRIALPSAKRFMMALSGTIICGLSIGIFQKANLGVDPFTCFVTGVATIFHSTYGSIYPIVTGLLLLITFMINRGLIGIATLINLFFVGFTVQLMNEFLDVVIPAVTFIEQYILLALAVVVISFGSSLYFTANLGVSAYDALSLTAAHKYKISSFRICRISFDLCCVFVGFYFNVTIGIGTLITALMMGPIIHWFNTNVAEPFLFHSKPKMKHV